MLCPSSVCSRAFKTSSSLASADAKPMANDISACNEMAVYVLDHFKNLAKPMANDISACNVLAVHV